MLAVFLLCAAFALNGAAAPVTETAAAEQNKSLETKPEELPTESTEKLDENGTLAQEVAKGNISVNRLKRATTCPSGWSIYRSRCFVVINVRHTWSEAESYCLHLGANLASIHSLSEYRFVQELVRKKTGRFPRTYIGGTDAAQNRVWRWTDGSRFDYSSWSPGEPNNFWGWGREACMEINYGSSRGWNDVRCGYEFPFVCATRP